MQRVLVIEDNPADVRLIREALKDERSIELEHASLLEGGLARIGDGGIDLVLLVIAAILVLGTIFFFDGTTWTKKPTGVGVTIDPEDMAHEDIAELRRTPSVYPQERRVGHRRFTRPGQRSRAAVDTVDKYLLPRSQAHKWRG